MMLRKYQKIPAWAKPLMKRTAFMQRLQDRIRSGYRWWVGGEIPQERWVELATKLDGLYRLQHTTKQRARDRARGVASAMLIAHLDQRADVIRWAMQVSDGTHAAHRMEKLLDATSRNGRVVVPEWGYELVKLDGKWTWRMTPEHHQSWRERIRRAAAHSDPEEAAKLARQIVWSLSKVPGFRGIRRGAFELRGDLLREWQRLRTKSDIGLLPPRPWPRLGYCGRMKSR